MSWWLSPSPQLQKLVKTFPAFSIKHNICIHRNITGSIWGIRNYLIPDDCCFSCDGISELICQEFSRGKIILEQSLLQHSTVDLLVHTLWLRTSGSGVSPHIDIDWRDERPRTLFILQLCSTCFQSGHRERMNCYQNGNVLSVYPVPILSSHCCATSLNSILLGIGPQK